MTAGKERGMAVRGLVGGSLASPRMNDDQALKCDSKTVLNANSCCNTIIIIKY